MSKTKAGRHEGNFTVRRPMTGAKAWARGDTRTDRVQDVAHLVESGSLVAKDKETAEATAEFIGREVKVGEVPAPAPSPRSLVDPSTPRTAAADLDGEEGQDGQDGQARTIRTPTPAARTATAASTGPSLKGKTDKQLRGIAKREGVTVEGDDNKADLVRKIEAKRKAEGGSANKAESTRGVQTKSEA
jgi:hypothetical protein